MVALATDKLYWNEKQKECYFTYEQHTQLLETVRYVDLVIPKENRDKERTDVHEYHIDDFVGTKPAGRRGGSFSGKREKQSRSR